MKERKLSTKDICQIISECSKHNVTDFVFDGLELRFKTPSIPAKVEVSESTPSAAIPIGEDRKHIEEVQRVENLLIEDPFEMEKRIVDGELIDEEV